MAPSWRVAKMNVRRVLYIYQLLPSWHKVPRAAKAVDGGARNVSDGSGYTDRRLAEEDESAVSKEDAEGDGDGDGEEPNGGGLVKPAEDEDEELEE
jgi:hypothetical protein